MLAHPCGLTNTAQRKESKVKKGVMISLCAVAALLGAAGLAGAVPRQSDGGTRPRQTEGATLLQPRLRDGATLAQAGAPTMVSYQGQVTLDGRPFDGTGYFKFAIVDPSVPETFWSNDGSSYGGGEPELPVRLTVTAGLFNVLLGDPSVENMDLPLEAAVFAEPEQCYLRVWFSEGGETFQQLSPDRRIASVPYALQAEQAANANMLGGRMAGNAGGRIPINNGTLNSNLNADRVDGQHAADLAVPSGAIVSGFQDDPRLTGAGYIHLGPGTVELWRSTSTSNAPTGRERHTAVWTGSEMLVWGGYDGDYAVNSGGRYDPATDTWTPIIQNAPGPRYDHTAVWTGSEMLVWGGSDGHGDHNSGGGYDPATDTWTFMTTTGAPSGRYYHSAVWTGSEMLVWGGWDGHDYLNSGGRYDPSTDTWTPITTTNAPAARCAHTAVWTGSEMLVWGGKGGLGVLLYGGRYDPSTDSWAAMFTPQYPRRYRHTAVWTGSEMIVWGGSDGGYLNTGSSYDPAADTWTDIHLSGVPEARYDHTAVWTGSEMMIWGGTYYDYPDDYYLNSGGRYNPDTDAWTDVTTADVPTHRTYHTAVWTGSEMIVWGGNDSDDMLNSGGRYCRLHLYQKP
jgi:N-acetylneuraminic acid mutarotase